MESRTFELLFNYTFIFHGQRQHSFSKVFKLETLKELAVPSMLSIGSSIRQVQ